VMLLQFSFCCTNRQTITWTSRMIRLWSMLRIPKKGW
jgi:hypothetical protein